MDHVRVVIEAWRRDYSEYRPYSSLGKLAPSEFAALCREVKRLPKKAMNGMKTLD
jgi:transposase InsO family protein